MHLVKTALTYVAIFCVGAVTSVSCFKAEFDNPSFRCNPSKATADSCPEAEVCCSDDPATTQGRLPNYFNGKNDAKYGVPIFSGANNPLSSSGMCVEVGGFTSPFADTTGCPVPCNPKWSQGDREAICGVGSLCCQMQELDPVKDCVLDPKDNKWRAVTGADIPALSTWGDKHTSNQDPQGTGCDLFASGGGVMAIDPATQKDCYLQLSVADRRGFCYKSCPCIEDVCAMKNPGYLPKCTGVVPTI